VRDIETEILPAAVAQGVGTIVWGPLAGGYLSGKFRTATAGSSRIGALGRLDALNTEKAQALIERMETIAASHAGATPSQVAINWLLGRPGIVSVLIGARTPEQLRDNLGAVQWRLGQDEIDALDAASAPAPIYPQRERAMFEPTRNPSIFAHALARG
jgi:aryl-alcohol dehydrogenase-like predicted oxidoreductase